MGKIACSNSFHSSCRRTTLRTMRPLNLQPGTTMSAGAPCARRWRTRSNDWRLGHFLLIVWLYQQKASPAINRIGSASTASITRKPNPIIMDPPNQLAQPLPWSGVCFNKPLACSESCTMPVPEAEENLLPTTSLASVSAKSVPSFDLR